jgi:hypothetical protein
MSSDAGRVTRKALEAANSVGRRVGKSYTCRSKASDCPDSRLSGQVDPHS